MISTATGPGSLYLTGEEELTYEWYREVVYSRRRDGRIFKGDLHPFALVAAVLVAHRPDRPPGERDDIHLFGLRSGTDQERSYIPAPLYFDRLCQEAAALPGEELPPVTPRYSWPGEAATLDEIRHRFTAWTGKPALRKMIDAHNRPWREGTPPEYAPGSRALLRLVGDYRCDGCRTEWTDEDPGVTPHPCPSCGAKSYPCRERWIR